MNEVLNGKPLQYITNVQSFMGFDFYVDENVLIPQPDTEVIVEQVINIFEKVYAKKPNVKILDLCTGSGAIAISLDKILNKYDNIKVYASDISASAINVAKKNSTRLNTNVEFIESNMFYSINNKFDIIVSNPPYIETNIIDTLASDVQAEPHLALDGGKDGLNFYRNIADNAYNYLTKSGYICLEIGYNQGETVKEILDKTKKYKNIEVIKDYSGNYRCVMAMGV
jgi:release factor glutamine methyltransferase